MFIEYLVDNTEWVVFREYFSYLNYVSKCLVCQTDSTLFTESNKLLCLSMTGLVSWALAHYLAHSENEDHGSIVQILSSGQCSLDLIMFS